MSPLLIKMCQGFVETLNVEGLKRGVKFVSASQNQHARSEPDWRYTRDAWKRETNFHFIWTNVF